MNERAKHQPAELPVAELLRARADRLAPGARFGTHAGTGPA